MLGLFQRKMHEPVAGRAPTRKFASGIHIDWSLYGGAEESAPRKAEAEPAGRPWMPHIAEKPLPTDDFLWALNEEPHKTRRMAILKAHPEVRKLMGLSLIHI